MYQYYNYLDVFAGTDGWNFNVSVDGGDLDLYAWKYSTLTPNLTSTLMLGQNISSFALQDNAAFTGNTAGGQYVKAWVKKITCLSNPFSNYYIIIILKQFCKYM